MSDDLEKRLALCSDVNIWKSLVTEYWDDFLSKWPIDQLKARLGGDEGEENLQKFLKAVDDAVRSFGCTLDKRDNCCDLLSENVDRDNLVNAIVTLAEYSGSNAASSTSFFK